MRAFERPSHGVYSALLAACAVLAGGGLFTFSLCLEPFDGDLTRIGELPESLYGRRLPQERFPRSLAVSSSTYDRYHDVVIVGDSFSTEPGGGAWTDFFIQETGASVLLLPRSLHPRDLLEAPHFRSEPPRVVIYESVERLLKERLAGVPAAVIPQAGREIRPRPLHASPLGGVATAQERRLRKTLGEGDIRQGKDRLLAELGRLFGLKSKVLREFRLKGPVFSSRRPDVLLVYVVDEFKSSWSPADAEGMRGALRGFRLMAESGGRTAFLTLIIPDKLSAYAEEISDPAERARARFEFGLGDELHPVDAGKVLRALIRGGTPDVYLPADTHVGAVGARAVAAAVLAEMRRRGIVVGRGGPS